MCCNKLTYELHHVGNHSTPGYVSTSGGAPHGVAHMSVFVAKLETFQGLSFACKLLSCQTGACKAKDDVGHVVLCSLAGLQIWPCLL